MLYAQHAYDGVLPTMIFIAVTSCFQIPATTSRTLARARSNLATTLLSINPYLLRFNSSVLWVSIARARAASISSLDLNGISIAEWPFGLGTPAQLARKSKPFIGMDVYSVRQARRTSCFRPAYSNKGCDVRGGSITKRRSRYKDKGVTPSQGYV